MLINFDQVFSNDFKCITLINHLEIILSFSNRRKPTFMDHRKILGKVQDVTSAINWGSSSFKDYG